MNELYFIIINLKYNYFIFMKSSKEIRQAWIDYFVSKKHLFVESKSLIPKNDPSLLWINSGVATLKDYFSGKKKPPANRLVNSQKCIRTNDIENVGITARHHTFFEMLGNFSIGDYFKNKAIEFAHEVVTQVFQLDQNRIYITYYEEDQEVKNKWLSLGYKEDHLIAGSRELNFWDVGSGPCGPNTEIFYDRGSEYHEKGPELIANDIENDRFIEIWNIVFSQYNNLGNDQYEELKQKNIDTGAGLERIVSILQNGPTNFDTDLFLPIIHEVEKLSNLKYDIQNYFKNNKEQNLINKNFKIIADHMRAVTNAINDGEKPSNTQRGYIIRRLIRRAYYAGKKLNIDKKAFLYKLVPIVKDSLVFDIDIDKVSQIIKIEEEIFSKTIEQGRKILEEEISKTKSKFFDVKIAFKLYETFGFPIEMTHDILMENDLDLDFDKLNQLKDEHINKSKSKSINNKFDLQIDFLTDINENISKFIGYEFLEKKDAKILYLVPKDVDNKNNHEKQEYYLILNETPLYATSGGQLHDKGYLKQDNNIIELIDVFKDKNNNHIHVIKGIVDPNKPIDVFVDKENRKGLMRNHSATHLTFAALRNIYGKEIEQLGSDNNQDRLTFDFPLNHKPTEEEIASVEQFVLNAIKKNVKREYIETSIDDAKKRNAIMTIEETEYFDAQKVRIVDFPTITTDLCGGTHVDKTQDIEDYKIVSIESKGVGKYRLRAITSFSTIENYYKNEIEKYLETYNALYNKYLKIHKEKNITNKPLSFSFDNKDLKTKLNLIQSAIQTISEEIKTLSKAKANIDDLKIETELVNNILFANNLSKEHIKDIAIKLRESNPNNIIVLLSKFENNKSLIIITSKNHDVLNWINKNNLSAKGGGNKLIWQGVTDQEINLEQVKKWD